MCVCVCVCVCVCLLSHISPLEHLFVLKLLSHTQWATEVKKYVGFSLKPLQLWCNLLTYGILQRYCSGILRNFSTAELSKALKKANSRLNATWNTTQCKAASFFLLSLRLLLTNLPYTFRYTHFSSVCTFQDSRTCGTEGSALHSFVSCLCVALFWCMQYTFSTLQYLVHAQ